ncbi:MAG: shikimate kinase [Calditrichaeota bacterium]|nr:MAG: shikimate kinase [Calditrichota bacterium]
MKVYHQLPWHGKNVYFLGFMGSGKSRIGNAFADLLGWPFHDTDDLVERQAGKSIGDIFAEEGEERFRDLETSILEQVASWKNNVIALGGGAVLRDINWKLITGSGITICLTAPPELLSDRIGRNHHRPLMSNLDEEERLKKINRMLEQRLPYYQRAQFTFESKNDRSVSEFVRYIFEQLMEEL